MTVFWDTAGVVRAIGDLPTEGPLPTRVVLVPRERVAHAFRRELVRVGRPDLLAGTWFITPATAAVEVLKLARARFEAGEEALRPVRLRAVLAGLPDLVYFDAEQLATTRGWDRAFATTIGDLESAGLTPDDLPADDLGADIAALWRAVAADAGTSWSLGRIYAEAAQRLESGGAWPFDGPVLVPVTGFELAAQARFLRAIPNVSMGLFAARPRREGYLKRLEALFGAEVRRASSGAEPPRSAGSERDLLASYLFEKPSVLADPGRPRSSGPDGTVELELYAGVEEEIEAAADWLAEQIWERATPLEDIAILLPHLDPLASLLVERLGRIRWEDAHLPVYVAGGLPVASTAGGARVVAILRALREYLSAAALADVLPVLRTKGDEDRRLSHGAALDLTFKLGCIGGSRADPWGSQDWPTRAHERLAALRRELEVASAAGEEEPRLVREARHSERLVRRLEGVLPALEQLVALAGHVAGEAPLAELWPALRSFLEDWVRLPVDGAPLPVLLERELAAMCAAPACAAINGEDALRVVEDVLHSLRSTHGRFGEPAVYVGTVRGAVGIPFEAVRVIGLGEGTLPPSAREDPVLPDRERRGLAPSRLTTTADRVVAELHALDRVVRDTQARVVLSAPRLSPERTVREPSSVFLEAAATLVRPPREGAGRVGWVPDQTTLARDYFVPARQARVGFRTGTPLSEAAWQDRIAHGAGAGPATWARRSETELDRIEWLLLDGDPGPMDGLLGSEVPAALVPGLTAERPVSAGHLDRLLRCPHWFLYQSVLGWGEPSAAPSQGALEPMAFGTLFHRLAERFARRHGEPFGRREGRFEEWLLEGRRMADAEFDAFVETYPLSGPSVREQQRQRLRRDFRSFLEYEWAADPARRYVAAERAFGFDEPVEIETDAGGLFIRGFIDRVDAERGVALVRDLKTGRSMPRDGKYETPDPGIDLQIGIYGLVTQELARDWGLPSDVVAAYVYPGSPATPERAFYDDFDELEAAATRWLDVAGGLLRARAFVRTYRAEDCRYCPFGPVCGPGAHERAARVLEEAEWPLAALLDLKEGVG